MPMTWKEACLKYNPDPLWAPKRGSEDYKKVAEIWGAENARASWDTKFVDRSLPPPFKEPEVGRRFERPVEFHGEKRTSYKHVEYHKAGVKEELEKNRIEILHRLIYGKNYSPKVEQDASQAYVRRGEEKGAGADACGQGQAGCGAEGGQGEGTA